ncbi:hypothetical protein M422DRAFT_782987 [Sphaerobolus stellatus SS14]|uniref:Uncharacterized protein n=1 Tax=Sphaerobolus stellatus (strain SS14) TaxID=990650 RepID=A0A0C9V9L8_SPHS4|nr:hypothetical protein M422DRAFT_782987 [Sphaerobolus stellatus SS14]
MVCVGSGPHAWGPVDRGNRKSRAFPGTTGSGFLLPPSSRVIKSSTKTFALVSTLLAITDPVEQYENEHISTSLDVEQLDTTLFRSKSLWVPTRARGVFGGQAISQALVSATNTVEPDYALHSWYPHEDGQ